MAARLKISVAKWLSLRPHLLVALALVGGLALAHQGPATAAGADLQPGSISAYDGTHQVGLNPVAERAVSLRFVGPEGSVRLASVAGDHVYDLSASFVAPTSALDDLASIRTTVSPQRQGRHLAGDPLYNGGGYLNSLDDAQGVLSAFHDGSANALGVTRQGHVVVEVPSITGFNVSIRRGFIDQPTSVFIIKGSSSPSVVPTNPLWTAGS